MSSTQKKSDNTKRFWQARKKSNRQVLFCQEGDFGA